jgi:hypothetical protein
VPGGGRLHGLAGGLSWGDIPAAVTVSAGQAGLLARGDDGRVGVGGGVSAPDVLEGAGAFRLAGAVPVPVDDRTQSADCAGQGGVAGLPLRTAARTALDGDLGPPRSRGASGGKAPRVWHRPAAVRNAAQARQANLSPVRPGRNPEWWRSSACRSSASWPTAASPGCASRPSGRGGLLAGSWASRALADWSVIAITPITCAWVMPRSTPMARVVCRSLSVSGRSARPIRIAQLGTTPGPGW